MEQEGKEGRATPYEDALSALALEHDDDDDARAHHQQQQQQREWAEGEEHQTPGVAEREDTSTPSASAAPAGASIPTDVSIDAAVPADFDNDGLSDQGSSCPSPSSPLLLLDPSKAKHMLVLSSAGKPIFSRHGDEQRLAPLMGMAQAIISLTAAAGKQGGGDEEEGPAGSDCVRFITTSDGRKFVFLARGELYLLAVAHTREPEPYLKLQLDYLYQQIVLLLTGRRIARCFAANPSYDLRDLLGGAHSVLASVVDMADPGHEQAGSVLTGAVGTVPLEPTLREDVARTLAALCNPTSGSSGGAEGASSQPPTATAMRGRLLYGVLLCGRRLAALVQPQEAHLQLRGSDLLLLINFVAATPSFRQQAESWTPLCLPRFNDTGFLYAYVGYLDAAAEVALLLVSANDDPEQFKACCHARAKVEAILRDRGWLSALLEASSAGTRSRVLNRYSNAAMAFHFLYKRCPVPPPGVATAGGEAVGGGGGANSQGPPSSLLTLPQCVASSFFFPYIDDKAKQTIWNKYARSLLQLRYGGRACWVHAGVETDRLLLLPSRRRPDESRDGRRDSLATSNSSSSSAFSTTTTTTTAAAPPSQGDGGPKACMMDVFDAPAEHSLVYEMRETDCVLVNVGADYELYALMSAAPDLQETIKGLNRLIRAIKRDERFLFQVDAVYWS